MFNVDVGLRREIEVSLGLGALVSLRGNGPSRLRMIGAPSPIPPRYCTTMARRVCRGTGSGQGGEWRP